MDAVADSEEVSTQEPRVDTDNVVDELKSNREEAVEDVSAGEKTQELEEEEKSAAKGNEDNIDEIRQQASGLTDEGRMLLYEKALKFKRKGDSKSALQCFLACLQGLKDGSNFPVLPQCLHNIAEIYSAEENYESAIPFAQAEKLYYETALITAGTADLLEHFKQDKDSPSDDGQDNKNENKSSSSEELPKEETPEASDPQAHRAVEFENLAHLCLRNKNTQLALEYCAKAVKIRQAHFGESHPVTRRTLDFFTVIYAEMGKEQYSAALDRFSEIKKKEAEEKEMRAAKTLGEEKSTESQTVANENAETSPSSGPVQDDISDTTQDTSTSPDGIEVTLTPGLALLFYFLVTGILAVLLTTFLCFYTGLDAGTLFQYIISRVRFYYYFYFREPPKGDLYF